MALPKKKTSRWASGLGLAVALGTLLVFLKNAWITDDAYIIHRSVEQLFSGNGPTFNAGVRVQAFTSPLWFWCLALFRIFSHNVFLNTLILSMLLLVGVMLVTRKAADGWVNWVLLLLLLVASIGFFDFTSSGLENPLCYLLLAGFMLSYERLFAAGADDRYRQLRWLLIWFGLAVFSRYDLVTLLLPPVVYACWSCRSLVSGRALALTVVAVLSPLLLWTAFSLLYYGFPFPNTAYAKLATGVPRGELIQQGLRYFYESMTRDLVTLLTILAAVTLGVRSQRAHRGPVAVGLLANVAYVAFVGGDFMLSRFLACAYLFAAMIVVSELAARRALVVAITVAVVFYVALYPGNPVRTGVPFSVQPPHPAGIAHERGVYVSGSLAYLLRHRDSQVFPDHHWSHEGLQLAASENCCAVRKSIGFYAYWAGTKKLVIDGFALTDPLLARLPALVDRPWRIGHFERGLPAGYVESLASSGNLIADDDLREYYERLRLITRGEPLLSGRRLLTIMNMNLGRYDIYLRRYRD